MVLSEMILHMTDSDIIAIRGGRCINKINLNTLKGTRDHDGFKGACGLAVSLTMTDLKQLDKEIDLRTGNSAVLIVDHARSGVLSGAI